MAKKAKGNRQQVILECTEHKESGMPGTSRYISTKNRKNSIRIVRETPCAKTKYPAAIPATPNKSSALAGMNVM